MKIEVKNLMKNIEAMRHMGITGHNVEFCQDELHIYGICECPEYDFCNLCAEDNNGCTAYEGLCPCMITIHDEDYYQKYYRNSEEKFNLHYPKTQTIDFKECLGILQALQKYDCIITPGAITFCTKDVMYNNIICQIKTEK